MTYDQQLAALRAKLPPDEKRLDAMAFAFEAITSALHRDLAQFTLGEDQAYDLVHAKFLEAAQGDLPQIVVYKSGPSPNSLKLGELTTIGRPPDSFVIQVVWDSGQIWVHIVPSPAYR